jgi:outer membrane protein assembly factor BamB
LTDHQRVWSERVEGPCFGSPVCVNGRLHYVTMGDQFKLLARIPLGEGCQTTPAVSGGRIYLRTATHLISVGK